MGGGVNAAQVWQISLVLLGLIPSVMFVMLLFLSFIYAYQPSAVSETTQGTRSLT